MPMSSKTLFANAATVHAVSVDSHVMRGVNTRVVVRLVRRLLEHVEEHLVDVRVVGKDRQRAADPPGTGHATARTHRALYSGTRSICLPLRLIGDRQRIEQRGGRFASYRSVIVEVRRVFAVRVAEGRAQRERSVQQPQHVGIPADDLRARHGEYTDRTSRPAPTGSRRTSARACSRSSTAPS